MGNRHTWFVIFLFAIFWRESYSQCGETKGCSYLPQGCSPGSADCLSFEWTYESSANTFLITLTGGSGTGSYTGVAFGQVNGMQDADLYYCTGSKLQSAVIVAQGPPTDTSNTAAGLENIEAKSVDGVTTCSFTRPASVNKTISSGTKSFDLTSETYYILLAHGDFDSTVRYHNPGPENREISAERVNLTEFSAIPLGGVSSLVKAHSCLMVLAWLLLSNLGISIARHFKPLFPGVEPGGVKLWFVQVQAHAIIGIIVMMLALTNPIMAMFRPNPNTERRPIFNWMHYSVGAIARTLAIANLFLGVNALGSLKNWIAVLGGFVGWVVLWEIVLEILSFHYMHAVLGMDRNAKKQGGSGSDMQIDEGKKDVRGQGVKTAVLVIYALGLIGFFIAFVISVV